MAEPTEPEKVKLVDTDPIINVQFGKKDEGNGKISYVYLRQSESGTVTSLPDYTNYTNELVPAVVCENNVCTPYDGDINKLIKQVPPATPPLPPPGPLQVSGGKGRRRRSTMKQKKRRSRKSRSKRRL